MRILALALGIAAVHFPYALHAQVQGRDAANWRTFESASGRYTVAFPATPVLKQGKLRIEIGEVASTRYTAGRADATYDVTYNDYPKDGIARLSPEKLMDAARNGLVFQSKGELVSEAPFTQGKLAGRELQIAGSDGMLYQIRLFLVANRVYQLTVMARLPARPEAQRFFDSFQLTGPASP